jgi:hypothetical protein
MCLVNLQFENVWFGIQLIPHWDITQIISFLGPARWIRFMLHGALTEVKIVRLLEQSYIWCFPEVIGIAALNLSN